MGRLPPIISLVPERFEDGGWSGVPRFDFELRKALPGLISMRTRSRLELAWRLLRHPDTIVITGNETSLLVPRRTRTIVVHHGCAQTHFDRDPTWRNRGPRQFCRAQSSMYQRPNRWYVALARWTAEQFSQHYAVPLAPVIPSWVEPIGRAIAGTTPAPPRARPVVLGDLRTFNKGASVLAPLQARLPGIELRALKCTYATRSAVYGEADAWLCLSLSEGGSFAMTDAEAAKLPIVTTDVGNVHEYRSSYVVPWQARDDIPQVATLIERALAEPRGPTFFEDWTFAKWSAAWRRLVEEVADTRGRNPMH